MVSASAGAVSSWLEYVSASDVLVGAPHRAAAMSWLRAVCGTYISRNSPFFSTHLVKWYHISLPSCRRGFDSLNAYPPFCPRCLPAAAALTAASHVQLPVPSLARVAALTPALRLQFQAVEALAQDGAGHDQAAVAQALDPLVQRTCTQLQAAAATGMELAAAQHFLGCARVRTCMRVSACATGQAGA